MPDPSAAAVPSFRECRQAARAVRSSQERRQAVATVRPRGVAVVRSRAPLAFLIRLAALEDRLVWWNPGAFAVLEAPTRENSTLQLGQWNAKKLRLLNQHWDMLISWIPAMLALVVAAVLALLPATRTAALLATLFAMLWAALMMGTLVVKGFAWLYRVLIVGQARDLGEEAIGQLCGLHWSVPLLHVDRPSDVSEILSAAARRVTGLVYDTGSDAVTRTPSDEAQRDVVLCLEHGVTTKQARDTVRATAGVTPLPGHPVLVVALGRDRLLREPSTSPGMSPGAVPLLLLTMATVLGVNAQLIAETERVSCAPTSCAGRPASYGDALYWLLNRLLGGDPEGLAAGTPQARVIGLLVSVMGLVVIGWVIASALRRAVARVVASGPELVRAHNLHVTHDSSSPRTGNRSTAAAAVPTVRAGGNAMAPLGGAPEGHPQNCRCCCSDWPSRGRRGTMTVMTEPIGLAEGRPFTVHDLETMPDDGRRYELIDGMLLVTPAPGWSHQEMAGSLYRLLHAACPADLRVLLAPFAVRTSVTNEVQPDVLVARYDDLTEANLPVAPVLAVEALSRSTQLGDRNTKKAHYERLGVVSYWLLDPVQPGGLEVYELDEDGHYRLAAAVRDDEVYAAQRPFPVQVCPARLLDGLRPR